MPGDKKKRTGEKRQSAGKTTGPARESLPAGPVVCRPKKCLHFQARYSIINPVTNKPVCRNGRRCGLKIRWWQHRVGSSPTTGTTSEWTMLHSKSPAVWLGFSHTTPSFLLLPTKLCGANFRGGPALRAQEEKGINFITQTHIKSYILRNQSVAFFLCPHIVKIPPCYTFGMKEFL